MLDHSPQVWILTLSSGAQLYSGLRIYGYSILILRKILVFGGRSVRQMVGKIIDL